MNITIHSQSNHRTTGLLKAGAIKETPIWYDVYKKYPPAIEPNSERPVPAQDPIPELVYEEDFERAKLSTNKYKAPRGRPRGGPRLSESLKDII